MAQADVATDTPTGGSQTALLSAQPVVEKSASAPQGFTIFDSMLLGMVIVWAANPAAIKWALDYIDPLTFNALRFALATLLPVGLILASKESIRWQKGDVLKIAMPGLAGHGIYQAIFILAISNTLAGVTLSRFGGRLVGKNGE